MIDRDGFKILQAIFWIIIALVALAAFGLGALIF